MFVFWFGKDGSLQKKYENIVKPHVLRLERPNVVASPGNLVC